MVDERVEFLITNASEHTGVYRFIDSQGRVLYIGKAKNLRNRLASYLKPKLKRIAIMVSRAKDLQVIITNTEADALMLEAKFIKSIKPEFNISLKDDALMYFLKINQAHAFPNIEVVKRLSNKLKKDKNLYIGPFVSSKFVYGVANELVQIFKIRNCSDIFFQSRKKPCFQYQINMCSAPCVNKISFESYRSSVNYLIDLVTGKTKSIVKDLKEKMKLASQNLEYEKAAGLRDTLTSVSSLVERHKKEFDIENADVVSIVEKCNTTCIEIFIYRFGQFMGNKTFYFCKEDLDFETESEMYEMILWQYYSINEIPEEIIIDKEFKFDNLRQAIKTTFDVNIKISTPKKGKKYQAMVFATNNCEYTLDEHIKQSEISTIKLRKIQQLFCLKDIPKRIEVYDNSHIMGKYPIGAMIVLVEGKFCKSHYRKHHLKLDKIGGDDYLLLRMVLQKRCEKIIKIASDISANIKSYEYKPDLILIDGGKGHLSVAESVLKKFNLDIPIVAIAKSEFRNKGNEKLFTQFMTDPILLSNSDEVMQYLQIMRDEAHNFAIKAHRLLRDKSNFE